MPVSDGVANLYIQLGVAGGALLIVLISIVLQFRYNSKTSSSLQAVISQAQQTINQAQQTQTEGNSNKIEKLCDKIDGLITSNASYTQKLNEVLLSNDKDQKVTISLLDNILTTVTDTQKRVIRIDDRTYGCLGNYKKDNEEE
ncbi:hypothetical protein [Clostridium intestinale]|uniref:hypothetical protein n=1 Tax=Clostridium intestinale TaxID=36845 RepID=UPI002DD62FB6|nr:hypothetical protein [Clostridium intestinale]WRY53915.1 hypothetical protein P8F83_12040 [Clostridium intestinale]